MQVKLPSGPQSCGNDRMNDVFIHNNLRSGGPMMDGGDGKEKGEISQEEGDRKEKGKTTEVPQECWEPCETEEEKRRARKQGVKVHMRIV